MAFEVDLKRFTNAEITLKQSLKNHCTFKTGGICDYYISVNSILDLKRAVELANEYNIKYFILGNGSNVLFSDNGFNGAIISLKKLNSIEIKNNILTAFAGANLNDVIIKAINSNLSNLEGLYGIPATVGGGVIMNASAFNYFLGDSIYSVSTLSCGKIKKYYREDCNFSYRHSIFLDNKEVVVSASFLLKNGDEKNSAKMIKNFLDKRNKSQPKGFSAGSVFVNPVGNYSARLIEDANLKGLKMGSASVSNKHANFILAEKNAKSIDIYNLIKYIKKEVQNKFNISLKEEIKFVGDFDETIR